ncbi:MAG: cadmium-translocating P-type ATPase [Xanthomonadales bacterium]|nr:cadmium-translocating P-type ATPase [Xanthomonadales bacterium]
MPASLPTAPPVCAHCASPAPHPVEQQGRVYCCPGCAAAATLLAALQQPDDSRVGAYARFDREQVQRQLVFLSGEAAEVTLALDSIRCAACAGRIEGLLRALPGVQRFRVDAATRRATIRYRPEQLPLSRLLSALHDGGFPPRPLEAAKRAAEAVLARRRSLMRMGVACIGAMQGMMFAEALYYGGDEMSVPVRDAFRWLTFLFATPVVFYSGLPFLTNAWAQLKARAPGMDFLIALSTLLAYFASIVELLRGGPDVYFDAAMMFVAFLLVARHFEEGARHQAQLTLERLAENAGAPVTRRTADGGRERIDSLLVDPGDVLELSAGDEIPVDGRLLEAPASVDESLLTGESRPVLKQPGDTLLAGSIVQERPLALEVTAIGTQTVRAGLARLVDAALADRPPLAAWGERVAKVFALVMMVIATLAGIVWWQIDSSRALPVVLAVLAATCPCALALALPAAFAAAQSRLAGLGVLVRRARALETLASVQQFVFDKTGTLTSGQPALLGVEVLAPTLDHERALALAAALEREVRHPLAAAFAGHDRALERRAHRIEVGAGVEALIEGRRYRLGRAGFAGAADAGEGLLLADADGHVLARYTLSDQPRADAAAAIRALADRGMPSAILSGDHPRPVAALAAHLGITEHAARMSPDGKLAAIRARQATGKGVAMVGDGVNDAPVLAGADVSFSLASGAQAAHQAADIVLTGGRLLRLADAVDTARRLRKVVRENFAWAIGYNLLMLPLALIGWLPPAIAALGMALSSLLVTLNALRLLRGPRPADGHPPRDPIAGLDGAKP